MDLVKFQPSKNAKTKSWKSKFRASKCAKMAILGPLKIPEIGFTKKSAWHEITEISTLWILTIEEGDVFVGIEILQVWGKENGKIICFDFFAISWRLQTSALESVSKNCGKTYLK